MITNRETVELWLSDAELTKLTGYRVPAYQMKVLKSLGIPARRRPDNSVLVMRMHCMHPATLPANDAPKLKSSRK
jgi:hypothetical protein